MKFTIREENGFQYIEEGDGHVLLLLHGLFGALSNFEDVIDHFSKYMKVVIPIMPIYSLPIIETNVKSLEKFIYEFIEYKKYPIVTLLGNSLGGHVGLVYAVNHTNKVHSMILTGSSGLYENTMGGTFPRREDYEFIKSKVAYTFYDPKHATNELVDEVFEIINNKEKLIRVLSLAKSAIRHNMSLELKKIKVPVFLIWGKNDNITPDYVAKEFNQLLENSELSFIDKCGHAPMMEHPQEFNKLLHPWLKKSMLINS